jgi:SAM-dependent methyltransferase
MAFHYADVVPWGRSYEEYLCMFSLQENDLEGSILGCGDGPASFNACLTRLGARVVSVDPLYQLSSKRIEERIDETRDEILSQIGRELHRFVWRELRDPEHMAEVRMSAMKTFLADYESGRRDGRYLGAQLPVLPFDDGCFDLAVSSHLLFFYAEQLDVDFHRQSLAELRRVAREVRIFPIVDVNAQRSKHVDVLLEELETVGAEPQIVRVPYEFQRGGNEMLVFKGT